MNVSTHTPHTAWVSTEQSQSGTSCFPNRNAKSLRERSCFECFLRQTAIFFFSLWSIPGMLIYCKAAGPHQRLVFRKRKKKSPSQKIALYQDHWTLADSLPEVDFCSFPNTIALFVESHLLWLILLSFLTLWEPNPWVLILVLPTPTK